ncbi:MAG: hypothetical protein HYZ42_12105 [Bacteroidetes bacterium]|nr:hypothetical protein [Bacteroidota bacterium]
MKKLTIYIVLFLFVSTSFAQSIKFKLKSGVYYPGLILAINEKTKTISGFFETYKNYNPVTGKPETFCRFFIKGELSHDSIRVSAYYPDWGEDTLLGRFFIIGDTSLNFKTQSEPPCWSYVEDDNIVYKGMQFDLDHNTNWIEIGMITKDNVKIYQDYGNELAKPIALAKYKDCAKVIYRKKGWLKIEISRDEEVVNVGWIRDIYFY